jgi:hypothetical protein
MPTYQKAYHLKQLREFPGWNEDRCRAASPEMKAAATVAESEDGSAAELTDDTIVYLDEALVVHRSCFDPASVIFESKSPAWTSFCKEILKFEVPDWEAESAAVRKQLANLKNGAPGSGEKP